MLVLNTNQWGHWYSSSSLSWQYDVQMDSSYYNMYLTWWEVQYIWNCTCCCASSNSIDYCNWRWCRGWSNCFTVTPKIYTYWDMNFNSYDVDVIFPYNYLCADDLVQHMPQMQYWCPTETNYKAYSYLIFSAADSSKTSCRTKWWESQCTILSRKTFEWWEIVGENICWYLKNYWRMNIPYYYSYSYYCSCICNFCRFWEIGLINDNCTKRTIYNCACELSFLWRTDKEVDNLDIFWSFKTNNWLEATSWDKIYITSWRCFCCSNWTMCYCWSTGTKCFGLRFQIYDDVFPSNYLWKKWFATTTNSENRTYPIWISVR